MNAFSPLQCPLIFQFLSNRISEQIGSVTIELKLKTPKKTISVCERIDTFPKGTNISLNTPICFVLIMQILGH